MPFPCRYGGFGFNCQVMILKILASDARNLNLCCDQILHLNKLSYMSSCA